MLKYLILALLVLCIATKALAQNISTYRFTAEITEVNGSFEMFGGDVAVGDVVEGRLTYRNDIERRGGSSIDARYYYPVGPSGIFIAVNGVQMHTVQGSGAPYPPTAFTAYAENQKTVVNGRSTCKNTLRFNSLNNNLASSVAHYSINSNIYLEFVNEDCSKPVDFFVPLPQELDLQGWDKTLRVKSDHHSCSPFNFEADITWIEREEIGAHEVRGMVYIDGNGDCTFNTAEDDKDRSPLVTFMPGMYLGGGTDYEFSAFLPAGEYECRPVSHSSYEMTCPAVPNVAIPSEGGVTRFDIAIQQKKNYYISGKVYVDLNGNCVYDAGEPGLADQETRVMPYCLSVTTDENGMYETYLREGEYELFSDPQGFWVDNCTGDGIQFHANDDNSEWEFNFGLAPADRGTIRGTVFADYDNNCEAGEGEPGLDFRLVRIDPGPQYAYTDHNGNFSKDLHLGRYTVDFSPDNIWKNSCTENRREFSVMQNGDVVQHDIGLYPSEIYAAPGLSVETHLLRPGFEARYRMVFRNYGAGPFTGRIYFQHSALLTGMEATPTPSEYSDRTAVWELIGVPADGLRIFELRFRVPPNESMLGRSICVETWSDVPASTPPDLIELSRTTICREVRGSYDPNDMQVFSGQRSADGDILPEDNVLTYLVRFQNEGNEDAVTVRVVDKLDENLNIDKLRIEAGSHDYSLDFTEDNELVWIFNNINLPPKERDEESSMGYVKFQIQLNDDLPIGTEIHNKAEIYFDYNNPVVTNTVTTRIADGATDVEERDRAAHDVRAFPNPASDELTVVTAGTDGSVISLNNIMGVEVLNTIVHGKLNKLDIGALPAGSYFLRVQSANATATIPLRIAR